MAEIDWTSYAAGLEKAASLLKMSSATIRLHAGEMTAQEMRSVQAVLRWKHDALLALATKAAAHSGQDVAMIDESIHTPRPPQEALALALKVARDEAAARAMGPALGLEEVVRKAIAAYLLATGNNAEGLLIINS